MNGSHEKTPQPLQENVSTYENLFVQENGKSGKNFFRKLIRMNALPLVLSTIVYLFQALPLFVTPLCTANIINLVTEAATGDGITRDVWIRMGVNVTILAVCIVQNVPTTILRWRIVSKMLRRTSAGIKCSVVRKLQSLSITYHKDVQTGKIQSKFLKDTDSVDTLFHMLMFSVIPNVLGVLIATAISIYKNGFVALFFLLVIPCNVAITFLFRNTVRRRYRDYRVKTEGMSTRLTTMLQMMPVTKAHGLEEKEIETVESSIQSLAHSGRDMDKTAANFGAWAFVVSHLLSALCLVFCSVLALKKYIGIGDIVLYQSMFTSISGYVSGLVGIAPQLSGGFEALHSVSEIMTAKDVEVNSGKASVPTLVGDVTFERVSYKYPSTEKLVVNDFSLTVKAGECIAVVGASGSGKSTLMNLIIGFLQPIEGKILIDGTPLSEKNLSEYRHHISVVPQNSILFPASIRDNITYGLDGYTEEELLSAVEMANINEFLPLLPDGLNTDVGEHGDKLSGGQRQRVTIARALIRNPRILILDEATSALDNVSEYHVQQAIARSVRGRTTFIVAHRLSTIRDADRIVVMENGCIAETGTYDELMQKKGKFFELKRLNDANLKEADEELQTQAS